MSLRLIKNYRENRKKVHYYVDRFLTEITTVYEGSFIVQDIFALSTGIYANRVSSLGNCTFQNIYPFTL